MEEEDYESVLVAELAVKLFRRGLGLSILLFYIRLFLMWQTDIELSYFWVILPMWIGPAVITLVMTVLFYVGLFSIFTKELFRKRNGKKEIQSKRL